jgi:hypothetical protein
VVDARGNVVAAIQAQRGVPRLVVSFNTGRSRLRFGKCVSTMHNTMRLSHLLCECCCCVASRTLDHCHSGLAKSLLTAAQSCPQRQAWPDGQVHGGGVPRRRRQRWRAGLVHRLLPAGLQVKIKTTDESNHKDSGSITHT